MGPLSAKQHREYLKMDAEESRKNSAFIEEQKRKEQLHQLKMQEASAKASQGISQKDDLHTLKLVNGSLKVPRINRQQLGLPSMNPLAGTETLGQGQKRLPGMMPQGTDVVPAMLTPGEAVIPAPAAQSPKNKAAIRRMVQEGRKANRKLRDGTVNIVKTDSPVPRETMGTYGGVPQQVQQAAGYTGGTQKVPVFPYGGFMNGTTAVPNILGGTIGVAHYNDGTISANNLDIYDEYPNLAYDSVSDRFYQSSSGTPVANQIEYPNSSLPPALSNLPSQSVSKEVVNEAVADNPPPIAAQPIVTSTITPVVTAPTAVPEINSPVVPPVTVSEVTPAVTVPKVTPSVVPSVTLSEVTPVVTVPKVTSPAAETETLVNLLDLPSNAKAGTETPNIDLSSYITPDGERVNYTKFPSIEEWKEAYKAMMPQVENAASKAKDEKTFTEAVKNLFTANGLKDALGITNQDLIRLAAMTLGGRLTGSSFERSFAYAGRNLAQQVMKREEFQREQAAREKALAQQEAINMARLYISEKGAFDRTETARRDLTERDERAYRLEDLRTQRAERLQAARDQTALLREQWKDVRQDAKERQTALRTISKEFGDLVPYVPRDLKAVQKEIVSATYQAVNDANKIEDAQKRDDAVYNAWLNGYMKIAQIADKTPKGTSVNTGDKTPTVDTVIDIATNTPVQVTRSNGPNGTVIVRDLEGRVLKPGSFMSTVGANFVMRSIDEAVGSVVPQFLNNDPKKPNPQYGQTKNAALTAFRNMGVLGLKVPAEMQAQIMSQAAERLQQAKVNITPDNLTKAIYAETIALEPSSPLTNVTIVRGMGGRTTSQATGALLLGTADKIMDLAKQQRQDPSVVAKEIEATWKALPKTTAEFLYERVPSESNAATWWYALPQERKDELLKELSKQKQRN